MSESSVSEENYAIRGIGLDWVPCFMTGDTEKKLRPNISGFVQSKEAGERIVEMFGGLAWLDYRDYRPRHIQVKVGVDKENEDILPVLCRLVEKNGNKISKDIIDTAKKSTSLAMFMLADFETCSAKEISESCVYFDFPHRTKNEIVKQFRVEGCKIDRLPKEMGTRINVASTRAKEIRNDLLAQGKVCVKVLGGNKHYLVPARAEGCANG